MQPFFRSSPAPSLRARRARLAALTLLLAAVVLWPLASPSSAQVAPAKAAKKNKARQARPAPARPVPGAGAKLDATSLTRLIDEEIQTRLDADRLRPSPPAADAEFLRRVYLDLVGVIPPPEKVMAFLESPDPNKRSLLIDELLADPRYGRSLAEIWTEALVHRESKIKRLSSGPLLEWLTDAFNADRPWNQTVNDLLTATGTQYDNGAVTFFVANPTADKVTDTVARLFLGVQLQCAQCHDHPFTGWKREEYWGMAAFFAKVHATARGGKAAKQGPAAFITEDAGPKGKKLALPPTALKVPPKFLQGERPTLEAGEPYRPVLARWLTATENPYFARAMVNRTWAHFFGRGLVKPVDDMHDGNPPTHPELLAALTEQFKTSGFSVKHLVRAICNSRAYQRASRPEAGNDKDTELLSHMPVRVLAPRQLYDSLAAVLDRPLKGTPVVGKKGVATKKASGDGREQFLAFFSVGELADPLEYQAGIPQALRLMNAPQINRAAAAIDRALEAGGGAPAGVIEQLYLSALARRPTAAERQRLTTYVSERDPRTGYGDILWALLNSSEFAANH
jgi:hypothetical protein